MDYPLGLVARGLWVLVAMVGVMQVFASAQPGAGGRGRAVEVEVAAVVEESPPAVVFTARGPFFRAGGEPPTIRVTPPYWQCEFAPESERDDCGARLDQEYGGRLTTPRGAMTGFRLAYGFYRGGVLLDRWLWTRVVLSSWSCRGGRERLSAGPEDGLLRRRRREAGLAGLLGRFRASILATDCDGHESTWRTLFAPCSCSAEFDYWVEAQALASRLAGLVHGGWEFRGVGIEVAVASSDSTVRLLVPSGLRPITHGEIGTPAGGAVGVGGDAARSDSRPPARGRRRPGRPVRRGLRISSLHARGGRPRFSRGARNGTGAPGAPGGRGELAARLRGSQVQMDGSGGGRCPRIRGRRDRHAEPVYRGLSRDPARATVALNLRTLSERRSARARTMRIGRPLTAAVFSAGPRDFGGRAGGA